MDSDFMYYFIPKIAVDDNSNLFKPFRIVKLHKEFPLRFKGIQGFTSVKELRRKDINWKKYHEVDPKSAEKITKYQFIVTAENFVITPTDQEFEKVSFKLLKHTVLGELSNEIKGIHLYSKLNKNIIEVEKIKAEDKRGVWIAKIKYYSANRDKIYVKEYSTMFPIYWNPTIYMFEVYYAYRNRVRHPDEEGVFLSTTKSGIPVEFVIKEGILRTVYPIYEN